MTNKPLIELEPREPSPHEAQRLQELITPFQREQIKELCAKLKTSVQAETSAMFGDVIDFYRLHRNSARALAMALQDRVNEGKRP